MSKTQQFGRCLCGDIVYGVSASPIHTTICHCKMCQRSTGSAYLLEPIFMRSDFNLQSGSPKEFVHTSDMSGKNMFINFCARCGTKLYQTFERFPEVIGVFGGTFDDPNWFERTPHNTRHIFVDSAIKGDLLPPEFLLYHQHTKAPQTDEKLKPFILKQPKIVE
jgi:hypothetical protein